LKPVNEGSPQNQADDLVSVIVPAYNATPYIKEALDSVFAQTHQAFEVIVVNDGSPDTEALEKVLLPYRDRIIYITQENRGLSGARNTGLRAATGSMVALLDADDIWMPNYLAEQTRFLRKHLEYDLAYCNALFFGDTLHDGKEYMDVCPSEGEASAAAIITGRCHVFVSVTARTEVLRRFVFDESLRSCEDFDCWLRFTAAGHRIGYHRKVLVRYRKHGASLSANPASMTHYKVKVLNNAMTLWPPDSEETRLLQYAKAEKLAETENMLGKLALRKHDIPEAINRFRAANEHYKSRKISAVILLLRVAPFSVTSLYKVRGFFFPLYDDQRAR
jgi:glycosyltransferase involved in cell wall biosynthesis